MIVIQYLYDKIITLLSCFDLNASNFQTTVKHGYSVYAYNEFTFKGKSTTSLHLVLEKVK